VADKVNYLQVVKDVCLKIFNRQIIKKMTVFPSYNKAQPLKNKGDPLKKKGCLL